MGFADRYGPWALITGASEGTGSAFARQLAAEGIASILVARRPEPLAALQQEIRDEFGVACVTASVDLAASDAFDRIVAAAGDREVGLFIANAGADPHGSRFLDLDFAAWHAFIQRSVVLMAQCTHHFAGPMRARRRGGVLLVNSGACYGGASFMATYSATKAYMLAFAEGLWAELRPHGVDVLTLVMSRTDTPEFRRLLAEKGQPVPPGIASADEVAALGLARLPYGPIQNWGASDDETGFAPQSAAARRAKVEMIDQMAAAVFGKD